MRAAVVDGRLEAVAGEPLIVTTSPMAGPSHPGGTMLAAGRYVYAPGNIGSQQMLIHQSNVTQAFAYVRNDPGDWLVGSYTMGRRGTTGDVWWAFMHTDSGGGSGGLGRHASSSTGYTWQSDMIGVAYGRTLTDPEAMRVIRWMIPRLGQVEVGSHLIPTASRSARG